jgi:hypothetical protein
MFGGSIFPKDTHLTLRFLRFLGMILTKPTPARNRHQTGRPSPKTIGVRLLAQLRRAALGLFRADVTRSQQGHEPHSTARGSARAMRALEPVVYAGGAVSRGWAWDPFLGLHNALWTPSPRGTRSPEGAKSPGGGNRASGASRCGRSGDGRDQSQAGHRRNRRSPPF